MCLVRIWVLVPNDPQLRSLGPVFSDPLLVAHIIPRVPPLIIASPPLIIDPLVTWLACLSPSTVTDNTLEPLFLTYTHLCVVIHQSLAIIFALSTLVLALDLPTTHSWALLSCIPTQLCFINCLCPASTHSLLTLFIIWFTALATA